MVSKGYIGTMLEIINPCKYLIETEDLYRKIITRIRARYINGFNDRSEV